MPPQAITVTTPPDVHWVMIVGLILACAAFIVYVAEAVIAFRNKPVAEAAKAVQNAASVGQAMTAQLAAPPAAPAPGSAPAALRPLPGLIKALPAMLDSLVKGGPSLTSLIGAVLFLMIGALSAGVFQSPAPP